MKNKNGFPEMYLSHVCLLQCAMKIYANNIYKVFEKEHIKDEGRCQDVPSSTQTPYL